MKNIRDIKTIDEVLETLKELYIANMTQLAILQHRVNKTDKEHLTLYQLSYYFNFDIGSMAAPIAPQSSNSLSKIGICPLIPT